MWIFSLFLANRRFTREFWILYVPPSYRNNSIQFSKYRKTYYYLNVTIKTETTWKNSDLGPQISCICLLQQSVHLGLLKKRIYFNFLFVAVRPQALVYSSRRKRRVGGWSPLQLRRHEQCCRSRSGSGPRSESGSKPGSAQIDIIFPESINISTKPKIMINHTFFPENLNMLSKILKIMTPMTLIRMISRCKLAFAVNESHQKLIMIFQLVCGITWGTIQVRFRIRIWIGIKMESRVRIRIGIKTMPTGHGFLSGIFVLFPGTCSMKLARGLTQPCSTMHCRAQLAKNPLEVELDSPSTTRRGKTNKNSQDVVERKVTQTLIKLPYDVIDPDPDPHGTHWFWSAEL